MVGRAWAVAEGMMGLVWRVLVVAAALGGAGGARADDCEAAMAAMLKLHATPNRMEMTEASGSDAGGKPEVSVMISTADRVYVQVEGSWHSVEKDPADVPDMENALSSGDFTCTRLREEAVGGVASTVYHIDNRSDPDTTISETIWVADDSGLPLRIETEMDTGAGDVGKSHTTIVLDYDDVKPPAGLE